MTRWKITLEYDGTDFCGWQKQAQAHSIQQTLEAAIHKFSGEIVNLHVAGRTDAGVHALGQVAHFDLSKNTTHEIIRDAVNFHVRPHKVAILEVRQVPDNFHARFDALNRRYRYQIMNRRAPSVLYAQQAWHVPKPLALEPMQEAAKLLIGKHDFSTFRAQHCQSNSPHKTLDELVILQRDAFVIIETSARSFLYHQVRNMVGTLMLVGVGQWSVQDFKLAFDTHDRRAGGPTAPAQGLFFVGPTYPSPSHQSAS